MTLYSILCKLLLHDVFFTHPFNNFKSWIVWVTTVLIAHSPGMVRIYHSENAESAPSLRWEYCLLMKLSDRMQVKYGAVVREDPL